MKKLLILIVIVFAPYFIFSQNMDWVKVQVFGGNGWDWGVDIAKGESGIYLTGFFEDTVSFGDTVLISKGGYDGVLLKTDFDGNILWAMQFGGRGYDEGNSINVLNVNNYEIVYVTGYISDTVLINNDTLISNGGTDIFILNLVNDTILSFANYGGIKDDKGVGISAALNNVEITATIDSMLYIDTLSINSYGGEDVLFLNLHSLYLDTVYDAFTVGGALDEFSYTPTSISNGNLDGVVSVNFESDTLIIYNTNPAEYDTVYNYASPTPFPNSNSFILKRSNVNITNWVVIPVNYGDFFINKITEYNNNLYFVGSFRDSILIGNNTYYSKGDLDVLIGEIDYTTGNVKQVKTFGSNGWDESVDIKVDSVGNVYMPLWYENQCDLGSLGIINSIGLTDLAILQLDSNLNEKWVLYGGGQGYDGGSRITLKGSNIYYTGTVASTATFGDTSVSVNNFDIFWGKIGFTTGIKNNSKLPVISIFPNPADEELFFKFPQKNNYFIKVYNLNGILVKSMLSANSNIFILPIYNLSNGMYIIDVSSTDNSFSYRTKFIKE